MREYDLNILEQLTPGEAALVECFRALPLARRRALLNALETEAASNHCREPVPNTCLPARPLAFSLLTAFIKANG